jgi:ABC-type nitrate/sulfonate/bicarbonate transport system substrate-binding protein
MLAACGQSAAPAASSAPPIPASSAAAASPGSAPSAKPATASASSAAAKPGAEGSAAASEAPKVALAGGDTAGYPIRISQAAIGVSTLVVYVAVDEGFFAQQHLKGTIYTIPSGVPSIAALSRGDTDFSNTPTEAVIGVTQGLPLRAVFETWRSTPWTVTGKAELKSLADLKGKTIAVSSPSTGAYLYLQAALKKAGMSMNDVKTLTIANTGVGFSQLAAGNVDAAALSPPFDAQAEEAGFHEVAFIGDALDVPYSGLSTTTGFIQGHRPQLVSVLRAMVDASAWVKAHPAEATDFYAKISGSSPDIAKRSVAKMIPLLSENHEASLGGIQQIIDSQAEASQSRIDVKPEQTVDYGPLHEALASQPR